MSKRSSSHLREPTIPGAPRSIRSYWLRTRRKVEDNYPNYRPHRTGRHMPKPSRQFPDVDPKLDKLLRPLWEQNHLDDLKDRWPNLPSLDETLRFVKGRPVWWKGSDQELLEELNLLPSKPSRQEVADALREVLAGLRQGE